MADSGDLGHTGSSAVVGTVVGIVVAVGTDQVVAAGSTGVEVVGSPILAAVDIRKGCRLELVVRHC